MTKKITPTDAARRVLATAVQAATGCAIVLAGLVVAGDATSSTVLGTVLGSFAVPVLTAVHRYAEVWLAQNPEPGKD